MVSVTIVLCVIVAGLGACGANDASLRYKRDMACIEKSGVPCDQAMKRCP